MRRRRPRTRTRAATLLAALLLAACSGEGRPRVASSRPASRIVSLSPAITETLFALGIGDRVVAVTDYCDRPEPARALPKVGGYANPSVESVVAARPDLVLASPGPGNREAVLAMERAGLRVVVVPAETLDETLLSFERIAEAAGVPEAGRSLARECRDRLDAVRKRVAGAAPVKTLFAVQVEPIVAAGVGTLPSEILEIAGGRNVVSSPRYPRLGIETVIGARPEVILQSRMDAAGDESAALAFWRRWPDLPAARAGRLYLLPGDAALRPGPRVADAAEEIATLLHPEDAR